MMQTLTNFLRLAGGIGVFLTACGMMSSHLETMSSDRLKKMFSKVSDNRLVGVMIGAFATVLIQSSGITTVMTIGFANAGIISLKQAASIIFGAEIGTTITGQIVALGMFSSGGISTDVLFGSLAGIGAFVSMLARKEKLKLVGDTLTSVGILFIGLNMMSSSMNDFAKAEGLRVFLAQIDSIVLLAVIGAVLTAIIHSSAAITSIAITMCVAGLINIEQGIYLTLGANIGTCLTGMMAGTKAASVNARRTSLIQLIFNIGGVVLVFVSDLLIKFFSKGSFSYAILFENLFPGLPHTQLAMFHTFFNVASVILVLPICDALVSLSCRLIPDRAQPDEARRLLFVDENMLATPPLAIQQLRKEIIGMSKTAIMNFNLSIEMILNLDFEKKDVFKANEEQLNYLNHYLIDYIVRLSDRSKISRKDHIYLSSTYHTINDLERIGGYAENITEYALNMKQQEETFPEKARNEIKEMASLINRLYDVSIHIYASDKKKEMKEAMEIEEQIDQLAKKMANRQIQRLNSKEFSANTAAQYLKFSNDTERIGDHLISINNKNYAI